MEIENMTDKQFDVLMNSIIQIVKDIVFAISFCTVFILMFSSCKELYPITKTAEGYTFEIDENQKVTLIKIDNSTEIVEIPSKISSYDVKKLGGDRVIGGILFSMTYDGLFEGDSTVKEIIIPEGVEIVGDQAIKDCPNLEKIAMPSTLTDIEIDDCSSLYKIDIPANVTNFSILRCDNLNEIKIADGNTLIEYFCFQDCSSLKSIILPNRIEQIPDLALSRCYSLETVSIPQSVKSIGDDAFEWCGALRKIKLPENLESIGLYAFRDCDSLKSIVLPQKITSIECGTFYGCGSLVELDLPTNIEVIVNSAFKDCTSLERINIYEKCTQIGDTAFEGCDKLTIYGIKGSYAEQYAKKHNIPFEKLDTTIQSVN